MDWWWGSGPITKPFYPLTLICRHLSKQIFLITITIHKCQQQFKNTGIHPQPQMSIQTGVHPSQYGYTCKYIPGHCLRPISCIPQYLCSSILLQCCFIYMKVEGGNDHRGFSFSMEKGKVLESYTMHWRCLPPFSDQQKYWETKRKEDMKSKTIWADIYPLGFRSPPFFFL